ncbi:lysylphosphatidylglycerol synthase transmembrane domain-containing protein [Kineococcus sp. SYSU DK001]|uniref:lysylphosphatidylglycerol synthase transmembrane domain-containing protein n=1 Tax=Kineococcus sp. SYSU DK001 TaxID=3383122 RepID=UPI003D7D4636
MNRSGRTRAARRLWRVVLAVATVVAVVVLVRRLEAADLGERLRSADPAWLWAAAACALVPLFGNVASMTALSPVRLPVVQTTLVWLATSFVNLVTPSSTGGVALTVRYLQQRGLPLAVAATTIGIVQSTSFVVTALLIVGCLVVAGRDPENAVSLPWPVLGVAAGIVVVVAVVVRRWPPARRFVTAKVVEPVRAEWPPLRRALTHPGRIGVAFLGHLAVPLGFAATLACCARAVGGEPPVALLVLVVVGSSAVTAAVPVPGGIGASEAALAAGLVATGVPAEAALSAALLHRALTFWLRVPPAWLALLWLRRRRAV